MYFRMPFWTRLLLVALVAGNLAIDQDSTGGLVLSPDVSWIAAALLAVIGFQFLADGWTGRTLARPRDFAGRASVVVPGQVPTVWETLVDPQTEVTLNEDVVAAGRLGPNRGLGEMQCFLKEDEEGSRSLTAHEVVEYEHERRALTRSLVPGRAHQTTETAVEAVGTDQVRIDLVVRAHAPAGMRAAGSRGVNRTFTEFAERSVTSYAEHFRSVADPQAPS
jgi:hypothetical protein